MLHKSFLKLLNYEPSPFCIQVASLRHRRILLLDALASSLRLPHTNVPSTDQQNNQPEESDMVLKRLAALHKGRKLLARVLRCAN